MKTNSPEKSLFKNSELTVQLNHVRNLIEFSCYSLAQRNLDYDEQESILRKIENGFDSLDNFIIGRAGEHYDFLLQVSQNLRQSTSIITGSIQLLKGTQMGSTQQNYLNYIQHGASSLVTLIDDLTSYVQIQTGNLEIKEHPFNLLVLLERLVCFFSKKLDGGNTQIDFKYHSGVPKTVVADSSRIQQILNSILDLSIQQTSSGFISINVKWDYHSHLPLIIRVADTGTALNSDLLHSGSVLSSEDLVSLNIDQISPVTSMRIAHRIVSLLGGTLDIFTDKENGNEYILKCPSRFEVFDNIGCSIDNIKIENLYVVGTSRRLFDNIKNATVGFSFQYEYIATFQEFNLMLEEHVPENDTAIFIYASNIAELDALRSFVQQLNPKSYPYCILVSDASNFDEFGDVTDFGFFDKIEIPVLPSQIEALFEKIHDINEIPDESDVVNSINGDQNSSEFYRVLVVEDNRFNGMVLEKMLSKLNCSVQVAYDGYEAINMASSDRFDVILMDCLMPEMNGFEATARMREIDQCKNTPIVAITASCDARTRKQCIESGMVDFLTKPVQLTTLKDSLNRWIHNRRNENVDGFSYLKTVLQYSDRAIESICNTFLSLVDEWRDNMQYSIHSHDYLLYNKSSYHFRSTFSIFGKEDAYVLFRDLEERAKYGHWRAVDAAWESVRLHIEEGASYAHFCLESLKNEQKQVVNHDNKNGNFSSGLYEKVIVIDADPVSWLVFEQLSDFGLEVLNANNQYEALALISNHSIQNIGCIICSDNTVEDDWKTHVSSILELDGSISVLLSCHHPNRQIIQKASDLGVRKVISKPTTVVDFANTVISELEETRQRRVLKETQIAAKKVGSSQYKLLASSLRRYSDDIITDLCYYPKQDAGGDFFVKIPISKKRHVFILTDVSGHDLEAAFVSAYFHGMIRGSLINNGSDLKEALESFNSYMINEWDHGAEGEDYIDKSVVVCAIHVDQEKDCLEFHLAGSSIPLLDFKDGTLREVAGHTGNPLGWFTPSVLEYKSYHWSSVNEFFIWSDGVEDLARRLGINLMTMITSLMVYQRKNLKPHWLANMGDDLLVVRLSGGLSIEKKTSHWIYYRAFNGADMSSIDCIQDEWNRSLRFLLYDITEDALYNVLLSCREGLLNKLKHGCQAREDVCAFMSMSFDTEQSSLIVEIEDEGESFDFENVLSVEKEKRPHCGSNLIQEMSNMCRYDNGGNKMRMHFSLLDISMSVLNDEN